MNSFDMRTRDGLLLLAGTWLMCSFFLGFTMVTQLAGWLAYMGGGAIMVLAAAGCETEIRTQISVGRLLLGAVVLAAPFAFGFSGHLVAMGTFVVAGLLSVGTGAMDLTGRGQAGGEPKAATA